MMLACLLCVGAALGADGESSFAPGVRLQYQGTVSLHDRDRQSAAPEKSFDVTWLVTRADADGSAYAWIIDERGAGGFGWSDRCGTWSQDAAGATIGPNGPALLFDYGTGKHVVPLTAPRFPLPDGIETGTQWEHDGLQYEVLRSTVIDDRRVWELQASNQFGLQRRFWVDPQTDVVVRYDARVFMNQGTEYDLAVRLVDVTKLDEASATSLADGVAALVGLRDRLKLPPHAKSAELSPAQLQTLAAEIPAVRRAADAAGATAKIAADAERDLVRQSDRTSALDRLIAEQTGKVVEPFEAIGAGDAKLTADQLRDRVTVLHFWEYRDTPLAEPYGQIGYLEFLYGRHKAAGVQVVGVAVDGRFQDPATAAAAAASVRRLKNFMNLTYPIVHDSGAVVRQFGDPRTIGAALPLFVVVDCEGRIAHYKTGHYELDREKGLKQLDDVVQELLGAGDGPVNK